MRNNRVTFDLETDPSSDTNDSPAAIPGTINGSSDTGAVPEPASDELINNRPTCVIFLGMAGSGKTSLVQRVTAHLYSKQSRPFVINLDPACHEVPYPANVDLRDTVNYSQVMADYQLGPNGAIVTCLNLFASQFDQLLRILHSKSRQQHEYVIIDTPGQIEVFTWSASGSIITETLAADLPTVLVYVMDAERSQNPVTFMSNMLYACSIMYRTHLPLVVAINKEDVVDCSYAMDWIRDFETFDRALREDQSYSNNLVFSMALVLDEFYSELKCCGVSAVLGSHVHELFSLIDAARADYFHSYRPAYKQLRQQRDEALAKRSGADSTHAQLRDLTIREHPDEEEGDDAGRGVHTRIALSHDNKESIGDEMVAPSHDPEHEDQSFQSFIEQHKLRNASRLAGGGHSCTE